MKIAKICVVLLAMFVAGTALAAEISLSDARAQISACIAKPAKMAEIVRQLSASNQVAFLAVVNEAIAAMPGSAEAKAAMFLNVDRAALSAAAPNNKTAMIAEVFATVPVEVLPVINERFAADVLNIKADPSRMVTNEQFTRAAIKIMDKVNERCATVENAAVRSTFAILMLINASNSTIPELTERLVKTLPETAQNSARTEWIPAALGIKQSKTYEPLLGSADNVGAMVSNDMVIRLAGPQLLESMLGDIIEGTPLINTSNRPEIHAIGPREEEIQPQSVYTGPEIFEPGGYQGQQLF